jgi:hypothetical protein
MFTPEESAKIQLYRQKVNDGSITLDELQEGLALLRKNRAQAHATSTASRTRKAAGKQPINSDDLLSELGG